MWLDFDIVVITLITVIVVLLGIKLLSYARILTVGNHRTFCRRKWYNAFNNSPSCRRVKEEREKPIKDSFHWLKEPRPEARRLAFPSHENGEEGETPCSCHSHVIPGT